MHLAASSLSHRKPTCQSSAQRQPASVWWLLCESDRTCWIIEKLPVPRAGTLSLLTVIICGEVVNNAHSFTQQPTTSNNCGDLFPRWNAKWSWNQLDSFCLWLELYCRGDDSISLLYAYFLTLLPFNGECCFFPSCQSTDMRRAFLRAPLTGLWVNLWKIKLITGACQRLNP